MFEISDEDIQKMIDRDLANEGKIDKSPYELEMEQMRADAAVIALKENVNALDKIEFDEDASEANVFNEALKEHSEANKPEVTDEDKVLENANTELKTEVVEDTTSERSKLKAELLAELQADKDSLKAKQEELDSQLSTTKQAYESIVEAQRKLDQAELDKKTANTEEEIKVIKSEEREARKQKARALAEMFTTGRDEEGAATLLEMLNEIEEKATAKNSKSPDIDVSKIVKEQLAKELEEQNAKSLAQSFQETREGFFKTEGNESYLEGVKYKVFKANFDMYQNSGERLTPEALFRKAKESTDQDLVAITGTGVQKTPTTPVVDKNLQQKVQEQIDAKAKGAKPAGSSKNEQLSGSETVSKKSQTDLYMEMLTKQGHKFK